MENKLRECFDDMVVYKDLQKTNFSKDFKLPSFLRDWLLKKFEDENGNLDFDAMVGFINEFLPKQKDWIAIKDRIVNDNEHVKFIAKISVNIDIKTQEISFALPDFGLNYKDTSIDSWVWEECRQFLVKGKENWGVVELGYKAPDDALKKKGKITLVSFKDFCPYQVDLDFYKDARKEFSIQEWIDIVLGAIDYQASGYANETQKITMISRLLPFVEKRLNLIELAPQSTGKSYVFGGISRYGSICAGGKLTRAKLFYDLSLHMEGLVCNSDYTAIDEIKTISFSDVDEMRSILKGYMENGRFDVSGAYQGVADAGIVLLGNISNKFMDEYQDMFQELSNVFHDSALIERIHGFIKGWDIPEMSSNLKMHGWALNSEYFCTIMHLLRDDPSYRRIVDELIITNEEKPNERDMEAIKRICTAFLKLLFPNVRSCNDISTRDFMRYCLRPAAKMRAIIKTQLGIINPGQFGGKSIPELSIKDLKDES